MNARRMAIAVTIVVLSALFFGYQNAILMDTRPRSNVNKWIADELEKVDKNSELRVRCVSQTEGGQLVVELSDAEQTEIQVSYADATENYTEHNSVIKTILEDGSAEYTGEKIKLTLVGDSASVMQRIQAIAGILSYDSGALQISEPLNCETTYKSADNSFPNRK